MPEPPMMPSTALVMQSSPALAIEDLRARTRRSASVLISKFATALAARLCELRVRDTSALSCFALVLQLIPSKLPLQPQGFLAHVQFRCPRHALPLGARSHGRAW